MAPSNAPFLELNSDGRYAVEMHEVICRMDNGEHGLCQKLFSTTQGLKNHLMTGHAVHVVANDPAQGNASKYIAAHSGSCLYFISSCTHANDI